MPIDKVWYGADPGLAIVAHPREVDRRDGFAYGDGGDDANQGYGLCLCEHLAASESVDAVRT